MIDRFGAYIRVGWSRASDEWLAAALTLPLQARQEAFRDISEMEGRSCSAVEQRAYTMLSRRLDADIMAKAQRHKAEHEAMRARKVARKVAILPSELKPPSRARLMGCK